MIKNNSNFKEVVNYLIFGFLTTLVNFLCYYIGHQLFGNVNLLIINIFAWIVSVLFAYFTNRAYVFQSNANTRNEKNRELFSFFTGRISTLVIEEIIIWIGFSLTFDDMIIKLFAQFVVIVLNYVISKFLVFK